MQDLQHIDEYTFLGMNNRYPSHLLPKGVFQDIQNALVDSQRITKRAGSTPIATTLGAFGVLGGEAFEVNGGSKFIIVCRNGTSNAQLYSWTGSGAFAAIGSANLTAGASMNFVQAANKLFGFNGTDVVDVASDGTTVTKNRATVPKGSFGIWFHNYLFVSGVLGSPNRVYWSALGDPTTFSGSDIVDINANDGDQVTGFGILNDELIVFKKYSIWSISGWSGATFATTTAAGQNTQSKVNGYGTVSHRSIIAADRDLYYLSFVGGIPHFRSLNQTVFAKTVDDGIVSYDIQQTMDGLNKSQLSLCAGKYDGKYIRWAVPNGSSTTNNLVLVFEPSRSLSHGGITYRNWSKWTGITPSSYLISTLSAQSRVYYTDATTSGLVFLEMGSTYSDNGTPVTMDVKTRDVMFDYSKKTKYKYMYHKYASGSAGMLQIKARIDQASDFALQETLALAGTSPGLGPTGTFTLGVSVLGGAGVVKNRVTFAHLTGTLLGVEFIESTANACEIYDYSIHGFIRGLRDH